MKTCSIEGCQRPLKYPNKGFCNFHYRRWKATGDPLKLKERPPIRLCKIEGCGTKHNRYGYCRYHARTYLANGDFYRPRRAAPGTGHIKPNGYKVIHHNGRQIGEHVIVMEKLMGRRLFKGETVHHKNGIRNDNRPENLELWASNHPSGQRVNDLISWAKQLLFVYDPKSLSQLESDPKK